MPDARADDWFRRTLRSLKVGGCSLLVTGAVPTTSFDGVSTSMLGRRRGRRARVLGLFGRPLETGRRRLDRLPRGLEPATVVNTTESLRSAAMTESRIGTSLDVRTIARDLDVFEAELRTTIDEVRRHRGPLDAGVLRVGVDSLRQVVDATNRGEVEAFVDRVGGDVRDADGMAHFVYPSEQTGGRPAWLDPLFDAVVEHRLHEERVQQRWLFPARDRQTRWFPLE